MLADEPTGELDAANEAIVLGASRELRDRYESTVVVVTHSDRVAAACDRVGRASDGKVASGMTRRRRRHADGARRLRRRQRSSTAAGEAGSIALARRRPRRRASEHVALLGRSGSGKTTLLHVLGGLIVPERREACCGRASPCPRLDAAARGGRRAGAIGYVFQGSNLLPNLTHGRTSRSRI